MKIKSEDVQGLAIKDYYNGKKDARIKICREDGRTWFTPAEIFFRVPENFSSIEKLTVKLAKGDVLDIGAGAGSISRAVQEKGLKVCALEISRYSAEIIRKYKISSVVCSDFFKFKKGRFDTVVMMMNGIGIVGTLKGLDRFFKHIKEILNPGAQILMDSTDFSDVNSPKDKLYKKIKIKNKEYYGEHVYTMEYKRTKGSKFSYLFVDPQTLFEYAMKNGFYSQVIYQENNGSYLARIIVY